MAMVYTIFSLLVILSSTALALDLSEDEAGSCHQQRKSLLEQGAVSYSQTVINRAPREVWPELFKYQWNPRFSDARVEHISGKPGQQGHTVLIDFSGNKSKPFYAKIIKVRAFKNVVWKIYPEKGCDFSIFQDFGLQEWDGKTLFHINVYSQFSPEIAAIYHSKNQSRVDADSNSVNKLGTLLKQHMER